MGAIRGGTLETKRDQMLKNNATERHNGPSYCLVTRRNAVDVDVLTLKLSGGETALPVYSLEDEAKVFLELWTSGCWRVREMTAGKLISVLYGLCASVDRVVYPLPGPFAVALSGLASIAREVFMAPYLKNEESSTLA